MPAAEGIALWCQQQSRGVEHLRRLLLHFAVHCEMPIGIATDLQDIVSSVEVIRQA